MTYYNHYYGGSTIIDTGKELGRKNAWLNEKYHRIKHLLPETCTKTQFRELYWLGHDSKKQHLGLVEFIHEKFRTKPYRVYRNTCQRICKFVEFLRLYEQWAKSNSKLTIGKFVRQAVSNGVSNKSERERRSRKSR